MVAKRIFDMGWSGKQLYPSWFDSFQEVRDLYSMKRRKTSDQLEIERLKEIVREKDVRIENLERQLGLRG